MLDRSAPTALYRLYARGGRLLYVGIAVDPARRMKQHARAKPWWPFMTRQVIEWHPSRGAAESAERAAISAENPVHNYSGTLAEHVFRPAQRPRGAKRPVDPPSVVPASSSSLRRLSRDTKRLRAIDARRDGLIVEARRMGKTWREIAAAAGLTEQATVNAARKFTGGELPVPE